MRGDALARASLSRGARTRPDGHGRRRALGLPPRPGHHRGGLVLPVLDGGASCIGVLGTTLFWQLFTRIGTRSLPRSAAARVCGPGDPHHPRPLAGRVPWLSRRSTPKRRPSGWRRVVGRAVGALILVGAVVAAAVAAWQWENRPETDDATVRANFVGIAPKVSGHIVDLPDPRQPAGQAGRACSS